ncbi:MAG: hypothetical protein B7Y47_03420 [Sphingomonas sp. 28-63-12]|nr:MAG: hypothetical protein B7Y47_03420 [Sphingomonas sp. 28-63-12]
MADREMGPGELATLARKRYKQRFFIGLVISGGLIGGLIGGFDRHEGSGTIWDFAALQLSPLVAVPAALAVLIGMVGVPLYMFGKIDELAVRRNLRGMAAGWLAVMGGFPAWFVLAAGGLAPAPTAFGVFLLAYGVTLITFLILKWRD